MATVFDGKPRMEVTTDGVLIGKDVTEADGFLAQPKQAGKYPGVIMVHEWWGLNDQIRSMAHILAGEGYAVLAVDLFKGKVATDPEAAMASIEANPNDETLPKLRAATKYIRSLSSVDSRRVGSIGWCYGGGQSFLLGVNEQLQATVIYYGKISTERDLLKRLSQPVLGIFGVDDESIPMETVHSFENTLRSLGGSVEIHAYEGAGHAFANPTSSQAFRKDQAVDAWGKTLDFLKRVLHATISV